MDPKEYAEKRLEGLKHSPFHPDIPADWNYGFPEPEVKKKPAPAIPNKPGPKTIEGKRRSSMNALKHALNGRTVLLSTDDHEIYSRLQTQYFQNLKPEGFFETELAQSIVDAQWRLNRIKSLEESLLAMGQIEPLQTITLEDDVDEALEQGQSYRNHSRAFANLSIYEGRIHRAKDKALNELKTLQQTREAKRAEQLEEALMLKQFDEMDGRTYNPQTDRFVFSAEELTAELHLRKRRASAKLAKAQGYNPKTYRKELFRIAHREVA